MCKMSDTPLKWITVVKFIRINQLSIGVVRMKKRFFIAIIILLLVISSIYLFTRKPDVNKVIETSVSEQVENNEDSNEDSNEDEEIEQENNHNDINEQSEQPVTKQLKNIITETVKTAVDFFKQDIYITAIGDSLTKGVGDHTKQGGYVGLLDRKINHDDDIVEFVNFGKSGNRSDQLLKRLKNPEIIDSIVKSDVVLITIGANDITLIVKKNITNLVYSKFVDEQEQYKERLNEILETIEGINDDTDIYVLGFYNPFKQYFPDVEELDTIVDDWNEIGDSVASEFENATFVPVKDLFDSSDENLISDDNFHPNLSGYHLMAERVLEYLTEEEE